MMYQAFHWYKQSLQPLNTACETITRLSTHSKSPVKNNIFNRHVGACAEIISSVTRKYDKPPFGLTHTFINRKKVPVTEEVVVSKPFCDLLHFKRKGKYKHPKILMVAPMAGHYASLLRQTVKPFLPDHEVYVTDWKNARDVPIKDGTFDLSDFVDYLVEFLQHLGPKNNLLAACQPCPGALAATAVLAMKKDPAQPQSLTLMAGPVNPQKNAPPILKLADKIPLSFLKRIVINKVPAPFSGKGRKVYPGFRQLSFFLGMNTTLHLKKYTEFYWNILRGNDEKAETHRRFYNDYNAVMDATSEAYLDTLKRIFVENHLTNDILHHRGEKVNFNAIEKTALFTVEGEKDQFCPPGMTSAAHEICKKIPKKNRAHHFQEGVGHYGVFSGSKYEKHIVPRIKEVIQLAGAEKAIAR